MMKRFQIVTLCALAMLAGCCNYITRTEGDTPYACAPYPYYCTWEDAKVLTYPFHRPSGPEGGIARAYATVLFPFFLVDLPFEAVLDTVFLPVDGIYALCRDKPKQTQGETEIIQEAK